MKRMFLIGIVLGAALVGCGRDDNPSVNSRIDVPTAAIPEGVDEGCNNLPVGDEFERVDNYTPEFSDPADIDNPLFPVGVLDRATSVGVEDGQVVRTETTRLKGTKTVTLDNGTRLPTVRVRTIEWRDGNLAEVTTDYYAQDDIGAVWYLGEDVAHYEDGRLVDNEGSWLAGPDVSPGMVMPANPQLGDVWRPENNCGLAFEDVTLLEEDVTVEGPRGTITNAVRLRVLDMDGTVEEKIFAPGYGELSAGTDPDIVSTSVAIPADRLPGATPEAIRSMYGYAEFLANFAAFRRWPGLADIAAKLRTRFEAYQATGIPPLLEAAMFDALDDLDSAIGGQDATAAIQAAIDIEMALLDLRLPYENSWVIDVARIKVWERRLALDRHLGDTDAVRSDLATIEALKKLLS
ncbi:MAG TPA: hypothetical protein VF720_09835 [Candidatus Eisenbacteria bacterium]